MGGIFVGGIFVGGIFVGGIFVGGIFGSRTCQHQMYGACIIVCICIFFYICIFIYTAYLPIRHGSLHQVPVYAEITMLVDCLLKL